MPNYNNAKIYKIWSPSHPDEIYIGSTTQPLAKRMGEHRRKCKRYQNGKCNYVTSFKILSYGDAKIELIEKVECKDKEELVAREGYYIRTLDCVNKVIPDRTRKEYIREYREANKDKINQKRRQYREANKDKIKQYSEANKDKIAQRLNQYYKEKLSEKVKCDCGSVIVRHSLTRHKKTKKHMNFINKKNECPLITAEQ